MTSTMNSEDRAITLYEIYRDYIEHEDTLLNVRMTWFLTTQAFLFSSYALLNQDKIKSNTFYFVDSINAMLDRIITFHFCFNIIIMMLICFFGYFTARRSFISIRATSLAIESLKEKWEKDILQGNNHPDLPKLTGGGSERAAYEGWAAAAFLPRAAMVIWVLIAFLHGFLLRS